PEHIEAHGGFNNYKNAKLKLFKQLESRKEKIINGKKIEKFIVANFDDNHVLEFINFNVDKIFGFGVRDQIADANEYNNVKNFINDPRYSFLIAKNVNLGLGEINFDVELKNKTTETSYDYNYKLNLTGLFNIYNALAATSVAFSLGFDLNSIKDSLAKIEQVKGRMQFIKGENNIYGVVDYAHDPNSVAGVYENLLKIKNTENKLIAIIGSCGGGRDKVVRFDKGNAAGALCNYVIVTNEDPYDDDPMNIIDDVFAGVVNNIEDKNSDRVVKKIIRNSGNKKEENVNAFKILDRREAILKAVSIAKPGVIIVCTGKGAEKGIAGENGVILNWEEIEELTNAINNKK
ncbi:MAG: cyanophycin synthetase, partial [Patescibacteria group bacterium]